MPIVSLALIGVLAAADPAADELRQSARAWEARERVDLARQSLEKLAALRAVRADDLLLLGEMDLRQSDLDAARQVLLRLQQEFPASTEAQALATEVRVASQDRLGLASVHRLAQIGRGEQVRPALRRLFPDGAPNGILGIEYYELLAAAPDGRIDAQSGLLQLMRAHPRDPRYVLALARLLARRAQTARSAVALLEPLRGRPDVHAQAYQETLDLAQATLARAPADTLEEPVPTIDERGPVRVMSPAHPPAAGMPATTPARVLPTVPTAEVAFARTDPVAEPVVETPPTPSATVWIWATYREARRLAADGDLATAQVRIQELSERYPEDGDARFARALWAEAQGDRTVARQLALTVPEDSRGEGLRALLERVALAPDSPREPARLSVVPPADAVSWSLQWINKPGDRGISALQSVSLPIEWRHELPDHSQLGLMAEAVSLDAGPVPTELSLAAGLGTVAVNGLGSRAGLSTRSQGVALGVAWHHRDWLLDIGTTPLGFLRSRWTGGIRFAPTVGTLDMSVEGFHRPVTSSLLSYAGRIDPGTGRFWGGVMESGLAGRVGRYTRTTSLSLSLRASALDGTAVQSNRRLAVRLAGDRVMGHPLMGELTMGAAVGFQSYAHNLLAYTAGNGGYFSPQSYTTLALPVEWTRRGNDQAWRLQLAPTLTHRHDAAAPWYPLDPLAMGAVIAADGDPQVAGGTVNGFSIAVAWVYEWRITTGVVGLAFEHDRSDYYRPIGLKVYYRPNVRPGAIYAPFLPYMSY